MVKYSTYLHAVYTEPRSCVKFLVANVALEVLRLLMLDQNLLIVKLPIAVPASLALNAIQRAYKIMTQSGRILEPERESINRSCPLREHSPAPWLRLLLLFSSHFSPQFFACFLL